MAESRLRQRKNVNYGNQYDGMSFDDEHSLVKENQANKKKRKETDTKETAATGKKKKAPATKEEKAASSKASSKASSNAAAAERKRGKGKNNKKEDTALVAFWTKEKVKKIDDGYTKKKISHLKLQHGRQIVIKFEKYLNLELNINFALDEDKLPNMLLADS